MNIFSQYNDLKLSNGEQWGEFLEARLTLPLPDLDEVLAVMATAIPPSALINLSKCSKRFYSFFSKARPLALNRLQQLLSHVDLGEYDKAESIWKSYPDLLTCRGIVFHPNFTYQAGQAPQAIPVDKNPGRYKYVGPNGEGVTAWQMALMNEEYERAKDIGNVMTKEEKDKQFYEIFPDGKIVKHDWDLDEAKKRLHNLLNALISDPLIEGYNVSRMSETTRIAQKELYDYVKPKPEHKTGLVFDANFYVAAQELYDDQYLWLKTWDRCTFWCTKVVEWSASCLGTGYLWRHSQGIGGPLRSHSGCVLVDGSSYFPFRRSLHSIPGSAFFVGYDGPVAHRAVPWAGLEPPKARRTLFLEFMSSKNEIREEFTRQYARTDDRCLIF